MAEMLELEDVLSRLEGESRTKMREVLDFKSVGSSDEN